MSRASPSCTANTSSVSAYPASHEQAALIAAAPSSLECQRDFHATRKAEVLPIIAAGIGIALAATGVRYLIRAGRRMREEEEEERRKKAEGTPCLLSCR